LWHDLKHLGLTSAQQQQAKALHDQVKAANANADRATKAANWRKMRAQLIGILTPAQRSQLQAIRRARGAASRGAAPNSAPQ
jgi:Spy/CpxP family protein refolding chaperone